MGKRRGEGYRLFERVPPLSDFRDSRPEWVAQVEWEAAQPEKPARWIGDDLVQIESRAWYEWHWRRGIYPHGGNDRPPLPKWLREAVLERDGYVCGLCEGEVDPADVHIDHIHPWSLGGRHELDNLQVAHSSCNVRKGARV